MGHWKKLNVEKAYFKMISRNGKQYVAILVSNNPREFTLDIRFLSGLFSVLTATLPAHRSRLVADKIIEDEGFIATPEDI